MVTVEKVVYAQAYLKGLITREMAERLIGWDDFEQVLRVASENLKDAQMMKSTENAALARAAYERIQLRLNDLETKQKTNKEWYNQSVDSYNNLTAMLDALNHSHGVETFQDDGTYVYYTYKGTTKDVKIAPYTRDYVFGLKGQALMDVLDDIENRLNASILTAQRAIKYDMDRISETNKLIEQTESELISSKIALDKNEKQNSIMKAMYLYQLVTEGL